MNDLQRDLKDMVAVTITRIKNLNEHTIDEKVDEFKNLPMLLGLTQEEIEEVKSYIKSEFSIKLDKGFLIEEKGHEKWFLSRKADLDMKYWERYKKYLIIDKNFSTKVVNTMDDNLDTLTDLLGDPTRNISYNRRGLIIGDVQSGKTANYTGLICKAVDSGYKVVILLTGTIEKLRQQTQKRIDEGFVGADSDAMMKKMETNITMGVSKYDSSVRPMVLTSTSDDFKQKNATNLNFNLKNINGPVIFVVKKNSTVLRELNKWLKIFNKNGDQPIDDSILLIDDEADNASVNTKTLEDPTTINMLIRETLKSFTKSSYVGFTATPFANIFIDPDNYNDMVAEDLFPKDYIYSLNAPSNYIGARNIFKEDGSAHFMLIDIDESEAEGSIKQILPLKHKSSIQVLFLPEDLKNAIATFILANTIEDLRGLAKTHRSMLINVSRFTVVQEQISDLVNEYLKDIQSSCRLYCGLKTSEATKDKYIKKLKEVFDKIYSEVEFEWEEIQNSLQKSCAPIIVQTINQRNGKNLSFDDYSDGLRMIAVGGMSLSRGLTLEGLVVSYFYRNSKMYDTLMQMGRWFGYRGNYKDLCRIWMPANSITWYSHISDATDELRDEVKRYEDTGLTPKDFGLRVRSDINALIVTARNKMKSTERTECPISLSGVAIETPELYSDKVKNNNNIIAIKDMVKKINHEGYKKVNGGRKGDRWGFKEIPAKFILELLKNIDVSPKNEKFNANTISKFIDGYKGDELKYWDIEFAPGKSSEPYKGLGFDLAIRHPIRKFSIENNGKILKMSGSKKKLGNPADGTFLLSEADIKNVQNIIGEKNPSMEDYFKLVNRRPLLIIYFVELGDCIGNETNENLIVEKTCKNLVYVGFGMGIPNLSDRETKYAVYVLNKVACQQMFEGEIDYDDDSYADTGDDED